MKARPQNAVSLIFAIGTALFVVAGRIETIHLTEGEALINGWPYWISAMLCAAAGVAVKWAEEKA